MKPFARFLHPNSFLVLFTGLLLTISSSAQQSTPSSANAGTPATGRQSAQVPADKPITQFTTGLDPKTGLPYYESIQEDWSSLQVGTSKLEPEPPFAGDPDDEKTFIRTLVRVKWRPGDAIDLWISLPKGVKNPPVVLYLYGHSEDTDRFRDNAWCERVTSGGVAAVGFVSALSGPRFHDRPLRQWFVSELQESLGSSVHDVKFLLDYLAARGDMDMNRVGMFGQGSGGAIAILAAAADPRIKAIDLLEPWGDWPHFLATSSVVQDAAGHEEFVKPEFLKKVAPLDPVKWLPQLKIPIRMQQTKEDDSVPMESKEALKDAAPKQAEVQRFTTKLVMFNNERGGILFDWVKDRLHKVPDAPKSSATASSVSDAQGQPRSDVR